MKGSFVIILVCLFVVSSCGVKRNNPLDPLGNPDVDAPATVANVTCVSSPSGAVNKYVEVRWDANSPLNTDGYYVYRGLAYGSEYSVVDTVAINRCNHGSEPWQNIFAGIYWYKVSAFKDFYDTQDNYIGRLEGRLSEARAVVVPN